jgi:hypothetical protein
MKTSLCVAALLTVFAHNTFAGQDRGGGGGFCLTERCVTLAEAGLRIDARLSSTFRVSEAQRKDLEATINLIPGDIDKHVLLRNALGNSDTFEFAQSSDEAKFEEFKKEYAEILTDTGFDQKGFKLLAVTIGKKTYLLPEFDKLKISSKSLNLIHESLIRDYGATVLQALKFDGMFLDYLVAKANNKLAEFDQAEFDNLISDLKMGIADHIDEYEIVEAEHEDSFNPISFDEIKILMQRELSGKLYQKCVKKTKDQNACIFFNETFDLKKSGEGSSSRTYYTATAQMKYLKSSENNDKKVHAIELDYLSTSNPESEIRARLISLITEKAMKACIASAKIPSLCKIQPQTLSIDFFRYRAGDNTYEAKIIVIESKK